MERKIVFGGSLPKKIVKEFEQFPVLLGKLLFYRGFETKQEAESFLKVDYDKGNFDPFLIKGMDVAVKRLLEAIKKDQ